MNFKIRNRHIGLDKYEFQITKRRLRSIESLYHTIGQLQFFFEMELLDILWYVDRYDDIQPIEIDNWYINGVDSKGKWFRFLGELRYLQCKVREFWIVANKENFELREHVEFYGQGFVNYVAEQADMDGSYREMLVDFTS